MAEAQVEKKAPADPKVVEEYLKKLITEKPNEIIAAGEFPEDTKIPEFENLTFLHCQAYKIKGEMLGTLLRAKVDTYRPAIVDTPMGLHIVRGFSRRDWAKLQHQIIDELKGIEQKHVEAGTDERWRNADLSYRTEEQIVIAGSVVPKYDRETVREIPSGTVTLLSQVISRQSGHDAEVLPPIDLK